MKPILGTIAQAHGRHAGRSRCGRLAGARADARGLTLSWPGTSSCRCSAGGGDPDDDAGAGVAVAPWVVIHVVLGGLFALSFSGSGGGKLAPSVDLDSGLMTNPHSPGAQDDAQGAPPAAAQALMSRAQAFLLQLALVPRDPFRARPASIRSSRPRAAACPLSPLLEDPGRLLPGGASRNVSKARSSFTSPFCMSDPTVSQKLARLMKCS